MNTNETTTIRLIVNAEQAQKKLDEINAKLEVANQNLKKARKANDAKEIIKYRDEVNSLTRAQDLLKARSEVVVETLKKIDRATSRELQKVIRQIHVELNSGTVERGSEEWDMLTEGMRAAKAELQKIREEMKVAKEEITTPPGGGGDGDNWLVRFGKDWVGVTTIITQAADAISALGDRVEQYVQAYADMAEHEAGVAKYTGMTREEVDALNESFRQMDTRTPREKLNDLAGDAGRLGIVQLLAA